MIKLWNSTGFNKVLKDAWEKGKVLCGVSAGACCWFKECSSDSLRILYGNDQPLTNVECLGFFNGFFTPHCDEEDRYESTKNLLKESDLVGILLSNCVAIEIINDEYRIIKTNPIEEKFEPFAYKTYWTNGQLVEEEINNKDFKSLDELLKR